MASLEENLVVHSDEEDLVSIKKNKKRKKFHEYTSFNIEKNGSRMFHVVVKKTEKSSLLVNSFELAVSIFFSTQSKAALLEFNKENCAPDDIDLEFKAKPAIFLSDERMNVNTYASFLHDNEKQAPIKINYLVLKLLVELSTQMEQIGTFIEQERSIIRNSAKKLVLATSIIIVHELVHLKWAVHKCSEKPDMIDFEPYPKSDDSYKGSIIRDAGFVYEEKFFGGIIELGYSLRKTFDTSKPIKIVLYYYPHLSRNRLEMISPFCTTERFKKFTDRKNWDNNLIVSPIVSLDSFKTNFLLKSANPKSSEVSSNQVELKLKIDLSSNEKFRQIVGLESTIINSSNESIAISEDFDYDDFILTIFDDEGKEVPYKNLYRPKQRITKDYTNILNPKDSFTYLAILYSEKSKEFLDLIKTELKNESEYLPSNQDEIQSETSDESSEYSDEMEDEILKQILYKDLPSQERQYNFSIGKRYLVNSQFCIHNIKSSNCSIDFDLQQDFSLIKRIDVPKNLSECFPEIDIFDKQLNERKLC